MRVRMMILKKRGRNMHLEEYNNIKDYTYEEYCEYLKNKYGKVPYKYGSAKNRKPGLFIHHIGEKEIPNLSNDKIQAATDPSYQQPSMLCYCDYLEHLLLHIMIAEETFDNTFLGLGGASSFLIPELVLFFDYGLTSERTFQHHCELVQNDKLTWEKLKHRYNLIRTKFNEKIPQYYTEQCQQNNLSNSLNRYYQSLLISAAPLWTTEELNVLKQYYPQGGTKVVISMLPNRTKAAIQGVASKLKIPSNHPYARRWTQEELDMLQTEFPIYSFNCPSLLKRGVTRSQIYNKLIRLRMYIPSKTSVKWTKNEDETMKSLYPQIGPQGCLTYLNNRTIESIVNRAQKLKLKYDARLYNKEEISIIQRYYPIGGSNLCHQYLPDRTTKSIEVKAKALSLIFSNNKNKTWTKEEDETIKSYYPASPEECASLLPDRTKSSITKRAQILGVHYESWSVLQITTLQNEYPILGRKIYDKYQNTIFKNKTRDAVYKYASSHNIPAPRQGRKLTPEETQLFKENYNKISLDEMQKLFPFLTRQAIKSKAFSLGLSAKRDRQILCVETSQVFSSFKEITQTMGLPNKNVWNSIHRGYIVDNKYHFKYLNDSDQTPDISKD